MKKVIAKAEVVMDKDILLAKAAYKAAEPKSAERIPYETLAPHWKQYWINVAVAVINELEKTK